MGSRRMKKIIIFTYLKFFKFYTFIRKVSVLLHLVVDSNLTIYFYLRLPRGSRRHTCILLSNSPSPVYLMKYGRNLKQKDCLTQGVFGIWNKVCMTRGVFYKRLFETGECLKQWMFLVWHKGCLSQMCFDTRGVATTKCALVKGVLTCVTGCLIQ